LEAVNEYYKTFSTLDLNAIVTHFHEPCMSVGPQGAYAAVTRAGLAQAFAPMIEALKAKGYVRSEFVEPETTVFGTSTALVRGVAVRYAAADAEIERMRFGYLMNRTDETWKIAVIVIEN
jgi:ketosteroid isomerase-like protein